MGERRPWSFHRRRPAGGCAPGGRHLVADGLSGTAAGLARCRHRPRLWSRFLGQTITVNVLGREITATVANLREIDWSSLAMNFTFILTPDALAGAPHSFIATVRAPAGRENAVERAVTDALPTISSIRVKEAPGSGDGGDDQCRPGHSRGSLGDAGGRRPGACRRHCGIATPASQRGGPAEGAGGKAVRSAARPGGGIRPVGPAHPGLVAAVLGSAAAWAVLVHVLKADWVFLAVPVAATALGAVLAVTLLGVAVTVRILAAKTAPYRPQSIEGNEEARRIDCFLFVPY